MTLANAANQRLLGETLGTRYEVTHGLHDDGVDLFVVDGITLNREWSRLQALRAAAEPYFLPVYCSRAIAATSGS